MRVRNVFLLLASSLAVLAACQVRTVQVPVDDTQQEGNGEEEESEGEEAEEEGTKPQTKPKGTTSNTCLGKANLEFDNATCNKCMSDSADCCAATIACFGANGKECAAMQACMEACKGKPAGADGGTCAGECRTKHATAVDTWTKFNTCTQTTCKTECGPGGGTTTTPQTPEAAFAKVFSETNPTCGSCHLGGTGGAPIFYAADAAGTRTLFKGKGYDKAGSLFLTKGLHNGPVLTDAQKTTINAWIAAEAAPPGGGTGTGGGTGGGGGNGTGGGK